MRAPLLLMLPVLLFVAACGGDDDDGTQFTFDPNDPDAFLSTALDAWNDVESYHMVSEATLEHDPLNVQTSEVDIAGERSRAVTTYLSGLTDEECERGTENGGTFERCFSVLKEIEEEYQYETIGTPAGLYNRTCEDNDCHGWAFYANDSVEVAFLGDDGLDGSVVQMLQAMVNLQLEGPDEDGLVHLSGGFNPARLAVDALVELNEVLDESSFGEECSNSSDGDQQCVEFTEDDFLEANEANIERFNSEPAPLDVWFDSKTLLPRRMVFEAPEYPIIEPGDSSFFDPSDERITRTEIAFSRFGDVSVDVPKLDLE